MKYTGDGICRIGDVPYRKGDTVEGPGVLLDELSKRSDFDGGASAEPKTKKKPKTEPKLKDDTEIGVI